MKKIHSIAVILFALLFLNLISCEKEQFIQEEQVVIKKALFKLDNMDLVN